MKLLNVHQREALQTYTDFVLCRDLHMDYLTLKDLPADVYNNFLTLLGMSNAKQAQKLKQ